MKRKLFYLVMIFTAALLTSCITSSSDISDVKNDEMVGETVMVSGNVTSSIKLGELSGFIVQDKTGEIAVSSQSLPAEGEEVTVRGVLLRDSLIGYYIDAEGWE